MKKYLGFLIALVCLFCFTLPVHADIAPPQQPPGANLEPGSETTLVRMAAEIVLLEVQANTPSGSLGQAKVTALFTMFNTGTAEETMAVRFPISASDGWFNYPEISGFTAVVDSRPAVVREVPNQENDQLKWAEFDVTFPPGAEVVIEVSYLLEGSGEYPYINFAYLLGTGAGWQGTIGSALVMVKLPYEANALNVFINSGAGWGDTTPDMVMQGSDLSWKYTDFEPGEWDNVQVTMVMPSAWQKILTEQDNVAKNPRDGEAWGRLGKLYKEISRLRREPRWDEGNPELFQLSQAAYQKALELLPNDALWHAGYAELIFDYYYWSEYSLPEKPNTLLAMQELDLACRLKCNEPFIQEQLDEFYWSYPEAMETQAGTYTFLWLTQTPTGFPTITPFVTETARPVLEHRTSTPTPLSTPTVQSASTQVTSTPEVAPAAAQPAAHETPERPLFTLCSGILIFPPLVIFFILRRRK